VAENVYSEIEEKLKVEDWRVVFRLWKYTKPYVPILILALVLIAASTALDLLPPLLMRKAIDDYMDNQYSLVVVEEGDSYSFVQSEEGTFYLQQDESGMYSVTDGTTTYPITEKQLTELRVEDLNGIGQIAIFMSLILFSLFFVNYGQVYATSYMGQKITHGIRVDLFRHLIRVPMRFFDTNPSGRLATRVANDTENLAEFFTSVITSMVKDVLLLGGIIIIMLNLSTYLGLITVAILPVIAGAIFVFRYFDRVAYRKVRTRLAIINAFLAEHISGMSITQLFNQEERKKKEFDTVNTSHFKSLMEQLWVFAIFRPLLDLLYYVTIAIVIWFGVKSIIGNTLAFGVLVAFISYIDMFFRPLQDIAEKYDIVQNAMASAEKIFKLMDEEEEKYNSNESEVKSLEGTVEFENVTFAYDGEHKVLKDISFSVLPKEKIAFVGETGAGKTSIISILTGLYKIQSGKIKIDGRNIYDYNLQSFRKKVGVVLQDVFLFSGSILDNIRLFDKTISREKVIEAAKYVYAHHFIERLQDKYDTVILERGGTLSAGERQLIALARAVVFNADILVLDEATANVDTETEALIQKAMERISKEKTMITIAHRLSTIRNADRIMVIHKGMLVESGTHEELLSKGGIYSDLYRLQYELGDIA